MNDKGLISKIYKQLIYLNIKKKKPNKNWAGDLNKCFYQEDIQTASEQMKRCSSFLIIREMQVKTKRGYHLTPVRMAISQKSEKQMLAWILRKENPCTLLVRM